MKKTSYLCLGLFSSTIFAYSAFPIVVEAQTMQTIAQQLDLSKAIITKQDLPSGFTEASPAELAELKQDINQEEMTITSFFSFQNENIAQFQLIRGGTILPSGRLAQEDFSTVGRENLLRTFTRLPQDVSRDFTGINLSFRNIEELPNLNNIGEVAAGWTMVSQVLGIPCRLDLAIFRRGRVLAFVMVAYLDGNRSAVPIGDIARKFDSRILESTR